MVNKVGKRKRRHKKTPGLTLTISCFCQSRNWCKKYTVMLHFRTKHSLVTFYQITGWYTKPMKKLRCHIPFQHAFSALRCVLVELILIGLVKLIENTLQCKERRQKHDEATRLKLLKPRIEDFVRMCMKVGHDCLRFHLVLSHYRSTSSSYQARLGNKQFSPFNHFVQ